MIDIASFSSRICCDLLCCNWHCTHSLLYFASYALVKFNYFLESFKLSVNEVYCQTRHKTMTASLCASKVQPVLALFFYLSRK